MALDMPAAEQTYGAKDCMLYALGVGLGHDPMNEDELPFVYEKNLKVLPTMGTVLGYPGFWARERDTGIDWCKIVNGEQSITLHRPLAGQGTVLGRSAFSRSSTRAPARARSFYTERKITDKASGEAIATVTQTTFCRADGGFGGPPRRGAGAASDSRARAGRGLPNSARARKRR